MKIYISGKISGLEKSEYTKNFEIAAIQLYLNADYTFYKGKHLPYRYIINPLDLKPFLGIKSWLCYMITDLYHLRKCSHIAMQKNWTDSMGAVIEYFFAKFIFKLQVIWL